MSLSAAAAAMGLPEVLVQRSAEARAAETGDSVDDILAAWAGGEPVETGASEPEPTAEAPPEEASAPDEETTPDEETPESPAPVIDTPEPATAPAAVATTAAPAPTEVTASQAAHLPEVVTVPTAGIRERTNFIIPKWLTGLIVIAPLFALFALGGSATGACGEATELATDIITGEIVNCDGSEFTGAAPGDVTTDFIALGEDLYAGRVTGASTCAGCHGANGEGTAAFPALTGVLTTFGSCDDHVEWVLLGSPGWSAEHGDTFGDTNKSVEGGMPGHAALTDEQLRAVTAFERVRFAGADREETLVDCGLADPEEENGEDEEAEENDEDAMDDEEDPVEAATGAGASS